MNPNDYMRLAIVMAQKVPQYPFGAVIVRRATGRYRQGFFGLPEISLFATSRRLSTIQEIGAGE